MRVDPTGMSVAVVLAAATLYVLFDTGDAIMANQHPIEWVESNGTRRAEIDGMEVSIEGSAVTIDGETVQVERMDGGKLFVDEISHRAFDDMDELVRALVARKAQMRPRER